ncbi:hypothetical protein MBLNU13_g08756t2 [Cladosporium sp. NU13]
MSGPPAVSGYLKLSGRSEWHKRGRPIVLPSLVAALAFLSPLVSAANIGRSEIEARDNVAACKAILIALKASQFCSSFVPIKDVTSTETKTGTTGTEHYSGSAINHSGRAFNHSKGTFNNASSTFDHPKGFNNVFNDV